MLYGLNIIDCKGVFYDNLRTNMTGKEMKKFKSFLEKEKEGLEKDIKKLKNVSFGKDIDSGDEETDEVEEKTANVALLNVLEERLSGIDKALGKIDAGTYGICEKCGEEISIKLLQVNPESKLCQKCKLQNG